MNADYEKDFGPQQRKKHGAETNRPCKQTDAEKLTAVISLVACEVRQLREQKEKEFEWYKSHAGLATKQDLNCMEDKILMKLSEVKTQVAAAAKQNTEAFSELGTRIGDLQKQIDELIAGASDPEVTDEAFLTDLNTLKTTAKQLADIVPNPAEPPTPS